VDAGHRRRGVGKADFPADVEDAGELTALWDAADKARAA
jgi:hypothetical protein